MGVIAVVGSCIGIVSYVLAPINATLERLERRVSEHERLEGHPGAMAKVATQGEALASQTKELESFRALSREIHSRQDADAARTYGELRAMDERLDGAQAGGCHAE